MKQESTNLFILLLFFAAFIALAVVYSVKIDQASRRLVESGRIPISNARTSHVGSSGFASLI